MMRRCATAIALLALLLTGGGLPQALPDGATLAAAQTSRRFLGYYVPYDPTSWASLETQAHLIDAVAAQWVTIDACGQVGSRDDQTLKAFARSRGIQVFPSLVTFSGWLNHRILTDDETAARAIAEISDYVVEEGYDGFDLDLEGVRPEDRAAYTEFVTRLGVALHDRDKLLTLALPAKTSDTRTGWGGAFDYAALGAQADLLTIMAYEYSGNWGAPGPIAPYDWVEQVAAFATSQIPPENVLLGLAFYGYDWNTTSGGARSLGSPGATALSERYDAPIVLDATARSETIRYRALGGDAPPRPPAPAVPRHEITERRPAPCPIAEPATPTPTPRPTPQPDAMQDHEVWLEGSASAAARLPLADRYGTGGVAAWRLGQEDASMWPVLERWRRGEP
jgi:spore germination protein YaaH